MFLAKVTCYKDKYIIICFGDAAAYRVYVFMLYPLQGSRSSLCKGYNTYIYSTICCSITGTYNNVFIFVTYNYSKEHCMLPEDDLRIETYNKVFTFVTCNFSKEHCMLPEDDLRIETCRSVLNILV